MSIRADRIRKRNLVFAMQRRQLGSLSCEQAGCERRFVKDQSSRFMRGAEAGSWAEVPLLSVDTPPKPHAICSVIAPRSGTSTPPGGKSVSLACLDSVHCELAPQTRHFPAESALAI